MKPPPTPEETEYRDAGHTGALFALHDHEEQKRHDAEGSGMAACLVVLVGIAISLATICYSVLTLLHHAKK